MKRSSKYRACDAEENGLQVDRFAISRHLVRNNGNLRGRLFFNKEHAIGGRQRKKSTA